MGIGIILYVNGGIKMTYAQELLLNSLYFIGIGWHSKKAISHYSCIGLGHEGKEAKEAFETPLVVYTYIFLCVISIAFWPISVAMAWTRDWIITRL